MVYSYFKYNKNIYVTTKTVLRNFKNKIPVPLSSKTQFNVYSDAILFFFSLKGKFFVKERLVKSFIDDP